MSSLGYQVSWRVVLNSTQTLLTGVNDSLDRPIVAYQFGSWNSRQREGDILRAHFHDGFCLDVWTDYTNY